MHKLCHVCNKPVYTELSRCNECIIRRISQDKEYYQKNKDKKRLINKRYKKYLIDNSLCSYCSMPLNNDDIAEGKKCCTSCRLKKSVPKKPRWLKHGTNF